MPPTTLKTLLARIPAFYDKTQGTTTISKSIGIPAPPNVPIVTIGTDDVASGSSDLVETLSSVGFSLDFLFANIQTIKDISYIGSVPVVYNGQTGPGPIFTGPFERGVKPGNIIIVNQNVPRSPSFPLFITDFINDNVVLYAIVINGGTFPFTIYDIIMNPGDVQAFNWNIQTQWQPVEITGFDPITNLFTLNQAKNAVYVPGPTFPGFTSPDLDNLGASFGVPRLVIEDDNTYRLRINQSVTGTKITPAGFERQFRIIYGIFAQIFQWFPTSNGVAFFNTFTQLVTLLNANPGYAAFYLDGSSVSSGDTVGGYHVLNTSQTQGPPNTFYIVIQGNGFLNFKNGVYPDDLTATPPDWTFVDYQDTTIGPGHHGGFFAPNAGDPDFTLTSTLSRYLKLISSIKAAGTEGILVVLP